MQEEIDSRVAKARRAYHMLSQRLWRQCGIRRRTKVKVFNAVVTPTLLYGAGTWMRKESQTKRLESVQCHLARRAAIVGALWYLVGNTSGHLIQWFMITTAYLCQCVLCKLVCNLYQFVNYTA